MIRKACHRKGHKLRTIPTMPWFAFCNRFLCDHNEWRIEGIPTKPDEPEGGER